MKNLEQLKRFIPTIKGISDSNRRGLLCLVEQAERELEETAVFALNFYADRTRYESDNARAEKDDPYTQPGEPYKHSVGRDWGGLARTALNDLSK
jgi:hypothetical protein